MMSVAPFSPELFEALDDLGFPSEPKKSYGIIGSKFIRELNAWNPHVAKDTRVVAHEHADSTALLLFVFERLGIVRPELPALLRQRAEGLAEITQGLSVPEQRQLAGANIHSDSPLRFAFKELDEALSSFHGTLYDGELADAKLLGDFIVDQAMQEVAGRLKNAS
jgi:hypothetical protein